MKRLKYILIDLRWVAVDSVAALSRCLSMSHVTHVTINHISRDTPCNLYGYNIHHQILRRCGFWNSQVSWICIKIHGVSINLICGLMSEINWRIVFKKNSMWPGETRWQTRSGSTLIQVIASAWLHEAINRTNVELPLIKPCGIRLRVSSSEDMKIPISKTRLKITFSKLHPDLQGANGLEISSLAISLFAFYNYSDGSNIFPLWNQQALN